jgi:hypothetical protein
MSFATKAVWAAGVAVALAVPFPASAQVSFGVQGGLSLASLSGDDAEGELEDTRTGFNAGAFVELPLADIIWLVPGAYYVQKGATSDGVVDQLSIDYLEVPLLLRVGVSERDPIGVNLFLGPTFAYQLKCEFELGNVTRDCEDSTASNFDITKSFDFGLMVGGGVSFAVSEGVALLANAFWDLGLTSIDESAADQDIKNEAILLNVGFLFRPQ